MSMGHTKDVPAPEPRGHGPGYETRDANPRALLAYGVILVVFLVVVQLAMLGGYRVLVSERAKAPVVVRPPADLYEQLRRMRHDEEERLTTYGWVDRKAGLARIPIERAMALVATRGVPKGKASRTAVEINSDRGTPVKAEAGDSKK